MNQARVRPDLGIIDANGAQVDPASCPRDQHSLSRGT